jgi:hypothetical protein
MCCCSECRLVLVWKTLAITPLLVTCRQINYEARFILEELKRQPIRLLSTTAVDRILLRDVLRCIALSEVNCSGNSDLRQLTTAKAQTNHYTSHTALQVADSAVREVHLAIKWSEEELPMSARDRVDMFKHRLLGFQTRTYLFLDSPDPTTRPLRVRLLPALFRPEDIAEMHAAAAIKQEPTRLILLPRALRTSRIQDLLDCLTLSHQNCSENEDVRNLLYTKHFSHGEHKAHSQTYSGQI